MSRAASRYAKAILENVIDSGKTETINQDMKTILGTIESNEELSTFLVNPTVSPEAKYGALLEIFSAVQPETKGLFQLLHANKRFELVEQIAIQYQTQFDVLNGIEVANVTTAFEMTPELEKQVLAKIATFSDKKITLVNHVDPTIIGGFILRIGDKQFNASVANRLQELKREFSN